MDDDHVGVAGRGGQRGAHRVRALAAPEHADGAGRRRDPGRERDDDLGHGGHPLERGDRPFDHRTARQVDERLGDRLPKAFATTGGHDERDRQYRSYAVATFAPADSASRLSRCSSASFSSLSSAYISSEARIFLARVNICFSPVDRPF